MEQTTETSTVRLITRQNVQGRRPIENGVTVDPVTGAKMFGVVLLSENTKERKAAAESLGNLGPQAHSEAFNLAGLVLNDLDLDVRVAAIDALGKIAFKSDEVVDALVKATKYDSTEELFAAGRALGKLSAGLSEASEALVSAAKKTSDIEFKVQVIKELGNLGALYPVAKSYLKKIVTQDLNEDTIKEQNEEIRAALSTLGSLGKHSIYLVDEIADCLSTENYLTRCEAIKALRAISEKDEVVNVLVNKLKKRIGEDFDIDTGIFVIFEDLGEKAAPAAEDTLKWYLNHYEEGKFGFDNATDALGKMGGSVAKIVIAALRNGDQRLKKDLLEVLTESGGDPDLVVPVALEAYMDGKNSGDNRLLVNALEVFENYTDRVPTMLVEICSIDMLCHRSWQVRGAVARLIAAFGPSAVRPLSEVLREKGAKSPFSFPLRFTNIDRIINTYESRALSFFSAIRLVDKNRLLRLDTALKAVREMGEKAKDLLPEIEALSHIKNRSFRNTLEYAKASISTTADKRESNLMVYL